MHLADHATAEAEAATGGATRGGGLNRPWSGLSSAFCHPLAALVCFLRDICTGAICTIPIKPKKSSVVQNHTTNHHNASNHPAKGDAQNAGDSFDPKFQLVHHHVCHS